MSFVYDWSKGWHPSPTAPEHTQGIDRQLFVMTLSDTESVESLLGHIGDGDSEALDRLMRKYRPYLRLLAFRAMNRMFVGKFDASDVAQQTCLDACNKMDQFRGETEAEFNVWISTILRHNLSSFKREYTTQKRDVRRESPIETGGEEVAVMWHEPQGDRGPVSRVILGEEALILAHGLSKIDKELCEVITLRFINGFTNVEIGNRLGMTRAEIAGRIRKGLAQLREHLPKDFGV